MREERKELIIKLMKLFGHLGRAGVERMAERIKVWLKRMIPERLSEGLVNEVLGLREWVPGVKRAAVHFGEGRVEVEAEGESRGIRFQAWGAVEVKGVRLTAEEQTVSLLPCGPLRVATDHQEIRINFRPGPGLLEEWAALLSLAPPGLRRALEISEALTIHLHRLPFLAEELKRRTTRELFGKKFFLLEYVEIRNVIIEPGAVRLVLQ